MDYHKSTSYIIGMSVSLHDCANMHCLPSFLIGQPTIDAWNGCGLVSWSLGSVVNALLSNKKKGYLIPLPPLEVI